MKKINVYVVIDKKEYVIDICKSRKSARDIQWFSEDKIIKFEIDLTKGKVVR